MQTLADKERVLEWALIGGITKNELTGIGISTTGSTAEVAYVTLFYEFQGWTEHVECERETGSVRVLKGGDLRLEQTNTNSPW